MARLAGAILRLVEGEEAVGPQGVRLTTRYTHRQLASMIGANREATTRALGGERMAMTLGRRVAVLVVTALMALTMVAGPVVLAADASAKPDGGKNSGWGDGNGGGKNHPKKETAAGATSVSDPL